MARKTSLETLRQKKEKAQEKVSRTKKAYDAALAELSEILNKEEAILNENLLEAFAKSDKTYDEVMAFMGVDDEGE
jgi:outer membrane protein TolC